MTSLNIAVDSRAVEHFTAKLRYETDPADVHAARYDGQAGFLLVDTRGDDAWRQGRIPGAIHLPSRQIPGRAAAVLDPATPVVTYCWGPGCNGSTRAALALAHLGYRVQELIGGFEYWVREGLPVETDEGSHSRPADALTTAVASAACDC
jgi:rhodanese-related sulfurtransferase